MKKRVQAVWSYALFATTDSSTQGLSLLIFIGGFELVIHTCTLLLTIAILCRHMHTLLLTVASLCRQPSDPHLEGQA